MILESYVNLEWIQFDTNDVRISKLSISTTKTTSGSVCSSILEHPAFVEALGLTSCDIL